MIYLLHGECSTKRDALLVEHYVGSTRVEQFGRRMLEHFHGYGCVPTSTLYQQGYRFACARVWLTDDRVAEYFLQTQEPLRDLCPICTVLALNNGKLGLTELDSQSKDPISY